MYTRVCLPYVNVYMYVYVGAIYQRVCMIACYSGMDPLVTSKPGNKKSELNPNSCLLWTQYTGDQRPTHEMIQRSVSVCVVKTRW